MASSSQKSEGRPFADHVRGADEMKAALVWLYDSDSSQLTGFLRSGPSAGRLKLLLACSRAVCEPPASAPSTSPDGPSAAPASSAAAASSGDTKPGVSTSKDSTTTSPTSTDASKKVVEPEPESAGAVDPARAADEASSEKPAESGAQGDAMEPPTTSPDGGTESAAAVTSEPSGQPALAPPASRFDHVVPPTFVDTSEVPRRAKVSTLGVHSLKVTLLSFGRQLLIREDLQRQQGHHRSSLAGMSDLYGRDDVAAPLEFQRQVIAAVLEGFRPRRPRLRGGLPPTADIDVALPCVPGASDMPPVGSNPIPEPEHDTSSDSEVEDERAASPIPLPPSTQELPELQRLSL